MALQGYINADEFIAALKAQGLVIVPLSDFELNKNLQRNRAMKRTSLTVKEIVDLNLLPLKTKKGVFDWIERGIIHADEVIRGAGEKSAVKVLTSAIRRLGYVD